MIRTRSQPLSSHTAALPPASPYFSVILCTYNRRALVLATLACLRRQTLPYELFEVVVVDNASSDGTFHALQAYLAADAFPRRQPGTFWRVRCLQETRNGLSYARRAGLQAATGQIAVFLDDDTFVDPTFLEKLMETYQRTGADAVSGRVDLRWEAPRPYWLSDDMLDLLGFFRPFATACLLPEEISLSSSSFSVSIAALQHAGGFTPFLGKRSKAPMNMEVSDLSQRLRRAGYTLWYNPAVVTIHRVSAPRLTQAFLLGRAYWRGRSEILASYTDLEAYPQSAQRSPATMLSTLWPELTTFLKLALLHRTLIWLARRSRNEHVQVALALAYSWGRFQQQFQLLQHVPALPDIPTILLVHGRDKEALFLYKALLRQGLHCSSAGTTIPLHWLWRHRSSHGQPIGIIHCYQPGAFQLTASQRRDLRFKLWLAHRLGLCIVSTDGGGWWHNVRNHRFTPQRVFERKVLLNSHLVLAYAQQPEQLYQEGKLRSRVHPLPHPALRGALAQPIERAEAYQQLGLSSTQGFIYLCLAYLHSEQELLHLIEAFTEMQSSLWEETQQTQLLLIGRPRDKHESLAILKRAALNPSLHLCMDLAEDDLPLALEASHALVMPHFDLQNAGISVIAMLFYSYERLVIAPRLPRLVGLLPDHASILYAPGNKTALARALHSAQHQCYHHSDQEHLSLDVDQSWQESVQRLLQLYRAVLKQWQKQPAR
ncbi:glycosyltransferase [Tengunoibacter tsumagoiensis]|uniref:Glycosyltransferase 2-like domain-containing protein n=1 Tax=Tengunoibacter tsumagoiensis TaxID=2014871 RepID=A0A401ZWG6_9CHLR|nr:glycosyltransferase [Tengunoibacter tsumagoiensis]GCE11249.1 hypothetical protein KTT_11080 [Tengunoibacter tsumagoiensis]